MALSINVTANNLSQEDESYLSFKNKTMESLSPVAESEKPPDIIDVSKTWFERNLASGNMILPDEDEEEDHHPADNKENTADCKIHVRPSEESTTFAETFSDSQELHADSLFMMSDTHSVDDDDDAKSCATEKSIEVMSHSMARNSFFARKMRNNYARPPIPEQDRNIVFRATSSSTTSSDSWDQEARETSLLDQKSEEEAEDEETTMMVMDRELPVEQDETPPVTDQLPPPPPPPRTRLAVATAEAAAAIDEYQQLKNHGSPTFDLSTEELQTIFVSGVFVLHEYSYIFELRRGILTYSVCQNDLFHCLPGMK
jgi:hypothetical protein